MNTILQNLIKLQEVDAVILNLQRKIDGFPKILQQLEKQRSDTEQKVLSIRASLEDQDKTKRTKEIEIETNVEKMKKYQGQLLQAKTNKEYSVLLIEIQGLKNKNTLTEDDTLELMESIERAKKALTEAQKELEQKNSRLQQETQEKIHEQQQIEETLAREQKVRETFTATIDPNILKEYTKLFNLRNGNAVVPVGENGVCTGCYVALTPQMFAEIRSGEFIHRCPTCFRFLYSQNSNAPI